MDLQVTTSVVFWSLLVVVLLPTGGSGKVNLVATDENEEITDYLRPGTTVTLNCSYDVDPLYVNFYNGTDKNIFVRNFITGDQRVGSGFEKMVKSNASGDGWLSIDFDVPYCYKDEIIKCTLLDQGANKHENKRIFLIGNFQRPSLINGTSCDGEIPIHIQQDEFTLTCSVFGVNPEANFSWPDGCIASKPVAEEDTTKCFFNQKSTAICKMDVLKNKMAVTCSADNGIGNGKCTLNFKSDPSEGTEGAEGTPAWVIVISITIPLVIMCILVSLLLVWKLRGQKTKNAVPTAGDLTPLPNEQELGHGPEPVVNVRTKQDVLDHLTAEMKKEVVEFVMEVEGLHYIRDIGKGHFGKVFLCKLIQETKSCLVAVKSMHGGGFRKPADVNAFLQEAVKIKDFRNDCILTPLGIVFHQGNPKIILPYMENGDLRGFLSKKMSSSGAFEIVKLLHFCRDVAEGMSYLSRQRFAHMDLAARNCMVDAELRVKVGDFGMTHDLYEKSYYRMSKSKPLPVRWMAPESITANKFTCKSDVWSYGVVMWEVFTHGEKPYKHLDNHQFLNKFTTGGFVRLEQPALCPQETYTMMCECWNTDPDERPRFSVMKAELERISSTGTESTNSRYITQQVRM